MTKSTIRSFPKPVFYQTLLLMTIAIPLHAAAQLSLDAGKRGGPDNTIKRGFVISLENNRGNVRELIKAMAGDGFSFMMGHRKLNLRKTEGNSSTCGYPLPEIYRAGDGSYRHRVDKNYVHLIQTAEKEGLDIMLQISGAPPDFPRDPRYQRQTEAERIANSKGKGGKGSAKGEIGKEFELPAPVLWDVFADSVSGWMQSVEKAVTKNLTKTDGFGLVWIGTEEVAHTIGYRVDLKPGDKVDKEEHVNRYVDHWSALAKAAGKKGMKTGGFQLNASNKGLFMIMAKRLLKKENLPPLSFITLQNYKADEKNEVLFDHMRDALTLLREKQPELYRDTKLVYNRYGWDKRKTSGKNRRFNSAMSIRMMLNSELHVFDYADICYGYAFMSGGGERMTRYVYRWLNRLGRKRAALENLPKGIQGFAFVGAKDVRIAIWNNGNNEHDLQVRLKNIPFPVLGTVRAMRAKGMTLEGKDMRNGLGVSCDGSRTGLSGIRLPVDSFMLLTIQ